jgi:hypothetical protein
MTRTEVVFSLNRHGGLQILADNVPFAQASPRTLTPLDTDHEFNSGPKSTITSPPDLQV